MMYGSPFSSKAAEFRFVSEVLLRDIQASFVAVDRGIDVIVGQGINVQVKSSLESAYGQSTWTTSQRRWSAADLSYTDRRESPEEPDVYALWAINDDLWFIVPSLVQKTTGKGNVLWINSKKPSSISPFEEHWTLIGADADGKWQQREQQDASDDD
jgi:hypothetical protein